MHLLERHSLAHILVKVKAVNQAFQTRTAQSLLRESLQSEVNAPCDRRLDKRVGNLVPFYEYGRGGLIDSWEEHGHTHHSRKHGEKDEYGQPLALLPYLPSSPKPPGLLSTLYAIYTLYAV